MSKGKEADNIVCISTGVKRRRGSQACPRDLEMSGTITSDRSAATVAKRRRSKPKNKFDLVLAATEEMNCKELDNGDFELIMRDEEQIGLATRQLLALVWYNRCYQGLVNEVEDGIRSADSIAESEACAEVLRKRWGNLEYPCSDFEWGLISGKLSALQWVAGWEWDCLGTYPPVEEPLEQKHSDSGPEAPLEANRREPSHLITKGSTALPMIPEGVHS